MPNVISELGNTLFQWQKAWPTAVHDGPGLDDSLRQSFERVVDHRIRPCLLTELQPEQTDQLVSAVRSSFGQLRGSIHPGEVGRFCHAVVHAGLGLTHPEQTWRTSMLPLIEISEPHQPREVLSIKLAQELDASRAHALPFPIRAWLPALLGLLAGLLIGWLVFAGGTEFLEPVNALFASSNHSSTFEQS